MTPKQRPPFAVVAGEILHPHMFLTWLQERAPQVLPRDDPRLMAWLAAYLLEGSTTHGFLTWRWPEDHPLNNPPQILLRLSYVDDMGHPERDEILGPRWVLALVQDWHPYGHREQALERVVLALDRAHLAVVRGEVAHVCCESCTAWEQRQEDQQEEVKP